MNTNTNTVVNRKELVKALETVKSAVPARATLPILTSVILAVDGRRLTVTGTDMDWAVQSGVDCSGDGWGDEIVVKHRDVLAAVKSMTGDELVLLPDGGKLDTVSDTGGAASLPYETRDQYPAVDIPTSAPMEISTYDIEHLYRAAGYAEPSDRRRPALLGVYMEIGRDATTVTATNGSYLTTAALPGHAETPCNLIIPVKPITLLHKLAKVTWRMGVDVADPYKGRVWWTDGATTIVTRLIGGPYPNYRQVIPGYNPNTLTVNRAALVGAIKSVMPSARAITHQVVFTYTAAELVLGTHNPDTGATGRATVLVTYSGAEQQAAWNGNYLLQILGDIRADTVTMTTDSPTHAMLITAADDPATHLLMPLHLNA